jgi:hypothetical protein
MANRKDMEKLQFDMKEVKQAQGGGVGKQSAWQRQPTRVFYHSTPSGMNSSVLVMRIHL